MRRFSCLSVAAALACVLAPISFANDPKASESDKATPSTASLAKERPAQEIDLVLCLDTSNSMDGLIESAKMTLWTTVNRLAALEPTPDLRVALYSYGNDSYTNEGWVRRDVAFTTDLDLVSQKLFELTTNGGTEYVSRVVRQSVQELDWRGGDDVRRMIFVSGNEPADQDPAYPVESVMATAQERGIKVHAIHCASPESEEAHSWRLAAKAGGGGFASIQQDDGVLAITTPYDERLAELGVELNKTYLSYTREGGAAIANQAAQDANAISVNSYAMAERAASKGSKLYRNDSWDLVDAYEKDEAVLEQVAASPEAPEAIKDMTPEELKTHVEDLATSRTTIQNEIAELNAKRAAFLEEARKQAAAEGRQQGLDDAMWALITE